MNSNKAIINKKNDWAHLITFNSFTQYFNTRELLNLSQLCSFTRLKLKCELFKKLNLSQFLNDKLKECSIGKMSESSTRFNIYRNLALYFKEHGNFITDLYLKGLDIDNYINLNEYSLIQITTLSFCNLIIPLTKFNLILDNSKFLEVLRIKKLSLTYLGHDKTEHPIHFPITLKSLDINKCRWVDYSQMTRMPMGSYTHQSSIEYDFHSPLATSLQHLPKLSKLVLVDNRNQYDQVLTNFILNNPQIHHLHTGSSLLTQTSLDLLEGLNQLKELTLDNCINNPSLQIYQLPKLTSIKSLKFKHIEPDNVKIVDKICNMCPLITHLYLDSVSSALSDLQKIVQNQVNLKHLKIKLIGSVHDFSLLSTTLVSLTLNIAASKLKLTNINNCAKLEKIRVEGKKRVKNIQFNNSKGYRQVKFNDSVNYYKC
jgi:hypothetical protein